MSVAEIEEGVFEATATIDNGSFGTRTIRFETGRLAQQAAGAVVAYLDDETMLLSATTASKTPKDHFDFFPLTIDVEERMYAAGRIPGSFFRREGRPSTDAILTCRLIDRPLRPTFVSGLRNEIQVVVTILSLDPKDLYDVLAINAASASTQISGLPFSGPVGGVRVALISTPENKGGQWVAFPTVEQLEGAVFDMVVAGRVVGDAENKDVAIMMVEAEATDNVIDLIDGGAGAPTESVVAEGLEAAKPFIAALCTAQQELADAAGKETVEYPVFPDYQDDVYYSVSSVATEQLAAALTIGGKAERDQRTDELTGEVLQRLAETYEGREKEVGAAFRSLTKKLVRQRILTDHFRIDGRGITDIRALSAEVAIVPRAHGSALFERGETQILGVTTLDMVKMAQQIDSLGPEKSKRYMHHYNFPPYSTGETGRVGSPKRREIGHGALAERALIPVLPSVEEFPYAIRQVSEALSSNGSTSMGSVCASTLALLNAGVPLKAPVAGIAMGLVSDDIQVEGAVEGVVERRFVTLTDILGAEDAFGDMDFKCAGTKDFVTALQLDTKLDGIPSQVLAGALAQAKEARLTILEVMAEAIDAPDEMSPYAPRVTAIKVPVDKIGEVIGPKGKMINSITEQTGASISIEDDGTVFVGATDGLSAQAAIDMINAIANPQLPTAGERFLGTVVKTTDFGAFVSLLPGRDGLVHISKLGRGKRIAKVEDVVNVGDKLRVEIAEIDKRGKISLVLVAEDENGAAAAPPADSGDAGAPQVDAPADAATAST
jgi:polyribonucleotide nucleotidyltransferase